MKVCFIGIGSIGKRHLKNLNLLMKERNEDLVVHVVHHSSYFHKNELVSKDYINYEEIDNDYDICFITNPTSHHYDAIRRMKNKAKFYFVEKPIFNTTEYDIKEFRCMNTNYYVACPLRYTKVFQHIQKIIKKEKVYSANARSSSYLPNWRPGSDYRKCYSASTLLGGGVDIDLIHELDYICELFGMPNDGQLYTRKLSNLEIDSCDYAGYLLNYDDKMVEIHLDYYSRKTLRSLELITDQSNYHCDFINKRIVELNTDDVIDCEEDSNDIYIKELKNFLSIIEGTAENKNTLEHAYEVLKLAKGEY